MVKLTKPIYVGYEQTPFVSPLPHRFVMEYIAMQEELERVKQRLAELENREQIIVLKELTREEAKKEIIQLFKTGRTLYYSDIVKELGIDLETVYDICQELQKDEKIAIDASIS